MAISHIPMTSIVPPKISISISFYGILQEDTNGEAVADNSLKPHF